MKGRVVLVGRVPTGPAAGRGAAALLVDGVVEDFALDPPAETPPLGTILDAKIGRPAPGKGAHFAESAAGPLFLRAGGALRQGARQVVQLGAYVEAGKARPASTDLTIRSRFFVVTPGRPGINVSRQIGDADEAARLRALVGAVSEGIGVIVRTAAAGLPAETLDADLDAALGEAAGEGARLGAPMTAQRLAEVDWTATPPDWIGYAPGIEPMIPSLDPLAREGDGDPLEALGVWDALAALGPQEALAGGAWMAVEPTRALVAVDVNTGGDSSPAGALKANLAALQALPRALRLRGLGGQVVVDPAPLARKDRRAMEGTLQKALRRCSVETNFVGWTPLGHIELTRRRERWPITREDLP